MRRIKILIDKIEQKYPKLKKIWEVSDNAYVEVVGDPSGNIERIVEFLISRIPDNFAYILLSEIAEMEELDMILVKEIFEYGDTSCKVSVCLRDNLSEEIRNLCKNSKEEIVKDHYLQKNK